MNIKYALGRAAAIVAAVTGLAAVGLTGVASASTGQPAAPAVVIAWPVCTIQSYDGHYLSAIGGGGRTTDAIETNRTLPSTWETFTLVSTFGGYGIKTSNGNLLTAVGGGGRTTDVIESNRTVLQEWEKFTLVPVATQGRTGWYAIQTFDGHYLTAVNSGGVGSAFDALHSNATQIQGWEEFYFNCG